jgi:hypothetical protein
MYCLVNATHFIHNDFYGPFKSGYSELAFSHLTLNIMVIYIGLLHTT